MLEKIFDSPTTLLLNKSMDAATLRNTVIADNIANDDTPGFKRREVVFEDKLQLALSGKQDHLNMKITNNRHILLKSNNGYLEPEIKEMNDFSFTNDGNNVDIDVESAKLAKNKMYYDTMAQSMNNEIKLLRLAITGRS